MTDELALALAALADHLAIDQTGARAAMHRRVTEDVPDYFAQDAAVTSVGHDTLELVAMTMADVIRPGGGAQEPAGRIFDEVAVAVRAGTAWGICEDAYRACMTGMWEWMMAEVPRLRIARSTQLEVIDSVTHTLFRWFDLAIRRARSEYFAERTRIGRSASQRRAELVRDLVAGRPVGELELGYPLFRWHRMMILWRPGSAMERDTVRNRLGTHAVMFAEVEDGSMWVFVGAADDGFRTADAVASLRLDADVRVAASGCHHGAAGLVHAYHEAMAAYTLALRKLDGRPRQVTSYREIDVESLLTLDLAAASRMASTELGPLAVDGGRAERLRDTLAAYVHHACNTTATAKALGMSERAVRHRLQGIEQVFAEPISERVVQLGIALRIYGAISWRDKRSKESVLPVPLPADYR